MSCSRRFILLLGLLGLWDCGRINYDALEEDSLIDADTVVSDATADAEVFDSFVISLELMTARGSYSFVDLAVDWSRNLAYLASRKGSECIVVVDFSDLRAPTKLGELAPPLTGGTCIGVALDAGGTRLLVSSQGAGGVQYLDLGSTPRDQNWSLLDTVSNGLPKRFAKSGNELWVPSAGSNSLRRYQISGDSLIADGQFDAGCPSNFVVMVGDTLVSGCYSTDAPIVAIDPATMIATGSSVPMIRGTTYSLWSGVASPTQDAALIGGWASAFVSVSGGNLTLEHRFDHDGVYRMASWVGDTLAVVVSDSPDYLERWDVSDLSNPVLTHRQVLESFETEGYGVQLSPDASKAVVVGNDGEFAIVSLDNMDPTTLSWPTF